MILEDPPLCSSCSTDAVSPHSLGFDFPYPGELFAQCPYDLAGKAVEPTLDSSRYFALRVIDVNSGKSAYLGMGFRERPEAFDFQVALQDWQK